MCVRGNGSKSGNKLVAFRKIWNEINRIQGAKLCHYRRLVHLLTESGKLWIYNYAFVLRVT